MPRRALEPDGLHCLHCPRPNSIGNSVVLARLPVSQQQPSPGFPSPFRRLAVLAVAISIGSVAYVHGIMKGELHYIPSSSTRRGVMADRHARNCGQQDQVHASSAGSQ